MDHLLAVYDVLVKFIVESDVKRIVGSEDKFWHESLNFELIPDAWIRFGGGESFIEVDRGTEAVDVVRELLAKYKHLKRFGRFAILFPGCRFKVLFITTTEDRIESLERVTSFDDIWYATMDEIMREKLNHRHWFARFGFYALSVVPKEEV